ncbi:uncharacterized protein BX663DRAFT_557399 [Cokeromyces recurvatus]|uniref:uncharacterized protein n=1 Tax=Cokeromyces recurvatus TaxID=90255 RepID=UPI00221F2A1B|nr:uncharacterized protein BX663DRAFT_557399 [Cokeromyces recurvatus]KAI7908249.1 hypothetical protein BX663DRAFT_557399 [Cokeromyces recurvatus]
MAPFNNLITLVITLLFMQAAFAHFHLYYPVSRGFNEDQEPVAPCGGFNAIGKRTEFPLKDGFVAIHSGHVSYSYTVNVLVNNNPTTSDFSSNSIIQVASGNRNSPQAACLPLDLTKDSAIKAGANATIQIIYSGGDGDLYQCTDIIFSDSPSGWNSSACINTSNSSTTSSSSPPSTTSSATSLTITCSLMVFIAACISYIIA